MDNLALMVEADRRGLLPPERKAMLDEAVKRGLVKAPDPVTEAINKSPTAGIADAALSLGSGAVAAPVAGIAGIVQGAKNLVSPGMPAADRVAQVQDALTVEPKTQIGQGITKAVSYPFTKLAELADAAGGAVSDKAGPATGTAVNTALQALPLMVGRVNPAAGEAAAVARRARAQAGNAVQDAATVSARDAGYAVPPTQANPSVWNKIVEGFGGKIKTAQDASLKNQPVTNALVREGLGLPKDAPLTIETLADLRKNAGQAYERVRDSGQVAADHRYAQALDEIALPFERAAKDFPDAARTDVLDAVKAARRDSFDASSAVDQISILRDKATEAYASQDKKLGGAYKGIANALEAQLERHLEQTGAPQSVIADFRNARQAIAKTYTVEKHLDRAGNVDARGLARDLQKGKPLSGEIKTAAEFGSNFPKAAQVPEKIGGVPMSPLDNAVSIGSLGGAVMSGQPAVALGAALPYLRPAARKMMISDWYQSHFAGPRSYGPSPFERLRALLSETQSRPYVPLTEISEGQRQ